MTAGRTARRGLLAGGNWIIDYVKLIDTWPPQDALATIVGQSWGNGGSPYNVLKDLAKLGAAFPLEAVGLVGDDASGRLIRDDCRAHQIDTTQLAVTTSATTSYTDVMTVKSTGRRTFFHQRGANALLGPEHFDFLHTRARLFHLGYALLLDTLDAPGPDRLPRLTQVLARARAAGLATSLDCVSDTSDRFRAIVTPVLPYVDTLFANDFETEKLLGRPLRRGTTLDRGAVEHAARSLVELGVRAWVLIHFPEGACACSTTGSIVWQPSVKVPAAAIAGLAGAGDAFAAGVLLGIHEEWPMARCLKLGVCAAAASLYHPTCSESVRPLADCLALGDELGFRPPP
ncbi:MAG TPA: carbohydrate kinase family protein [Opitutaceae bacterium]|nr:carbohydrate kinase family protein [Opitutaceae bacterium]